MKFSVTPLHPLFVARITGLDLGEPINQTTQLGVERTIDQYAVCVLPDQHLNDEQQIAFSRLYGPLEAAPRKAIGSSGGTDLRRRIEHQEIFDVSNLDEKGAILDEKHGRSSFRLANQLWHTDSSFRQQSVSWSMLHARVVPPTGGDTEFADMRAAYDALPDGMKRRLEGLIAEHSLWQSRAKLGGYVPTEEERKAHPPARHHLVRLHPGSGRNALYIASHASHIIGMAIEEGQELLSELIEFATRPQFVYSHKWQVADLVIWDNRCTMHRATPFAAADHVRDMRRTTIIDKAREALVG